MDVDVDAGVDEEVNIGEVDVEEEDDWI